jgi:uncharacterized protein (DUF4415 family)
MPKLKTGHISPSLEEDLVIDAGIASDPDTFELSTEDVAKLQPIRPRGRPPSPNAKRPVKLRLDPEVVDGFRATGPGWQSRINEVLRDHVQSLPRTRTQTRLDEQSKNTVYRESTSRHHNTRYDMVAKDQLFVERRPQGDYAVRRPDSDRASAVLPTQAEAIARARELNPNREPLVERVRNTSVGNPDKWRKP